MSRRSNNGVRQGVAGRSKARRRLQAALFVVATVVCAMWAERVQAAEDGDALVEAYLERHQLKDLLARHLEERIENTPEADQRRELTKRLAEVYAQLLESTTDERVRASLEQRSKTLLAGANASAATTRELRLSLLRASYRGAESISERHRLRQASDEELKTARTTLDDVIPALQEIRRQFKEGVEADDRRLSRAIGAEAAAIQTEAARTRALYEQATFITAWALYYQSWLNGRADHARVAEPLFAELLGSTTPSPLPSDVSVDLRSAEPIARCILGMALCKSMSSAWEVAISWIELLNDPNTYAPLRDQMPAWKLAILLDHKEFEVALDVLKELEADGVEIPPPWLRLAAVAALEAPERSRPVQDVLAFAMTGLASREDLQQLLEIAKRYGTEAISAGGFALKYVTGVIKYQEAREAHHSEEPTLESALVARYEEAATALEEALRQPDASASAGSLGACRRLVAWCRFFQSRFLDASTWFEQAAEELPDGERPESLWMAIVCIDRVVQSASEPSLQARLNVLIARFLDRYPSNQHAGNLVLRRVAASGKVSMEAVEELLAISNTSDVYAASRRQASQMLLQMFRGAGPGERQAMGRRFLEIAGPLVEQARDPDAAVLISRQILEVALSDDVQSLAAAREALQHLEDVHAQQPERTADIREEIQFRRIQERLLSHDAAAAAKAADDLWNSDARSPWSTFASRIMFRWGHGAWKGDAATPAEASAAMEMVVRFGGRVLREYHDDPSALDEPSVLSYHAAVAEASMALYEARGREEDGRAALYLYEKLLSIKPRSSTYLRAAAKLSERLGPVEQAVDYWRRIVQGTSASSPGWFEAKFHYVQTLSRVDRARAKAVLEQHKRLFPEYGPDPWGPRIKGLEEQVGDGGDAGQAAREEPAS